MEHPDEGFSRQPDFPAPAGGEVPPDGSVWNPEQFGTLAQALEVAEIDPDTLASEARHDLERSATHHEELGGDLYEQAKSGPSFGGGLGICEIRCLSKGCYGMTSSATPKMLDHSDGKASTE